MQRILTDKNYIGHISATRAFLIFKTYCKQYFCVPPPPVSFVLLLKKTTKALYSACIYNWLEFSKNKMT